MNEQYEQKEILGFSRSMFGQCILLYLGICAGLWVHSLFLVLVAGYTLYIAVCGKKESLYYHLFFSLPFTMIYKLNPTSTSLFAYVMLASGAVALFRIRSFGKEQLTFILLYAAYIFVGMGTNFTTVLKMLMALVLFYYFVQNIQPQEYKNQIMSFSLGMIGSSVIGTLKTNWPRLDAYFSDMNSIYVNGEATSRFSALYLDPNYFSIGIICAIFLCVLLIFTKKGNPVILSVAIVTMAIFGFLSYSKMFLLSIILLVLAFTLYKVKSPKQILTAVCILCLVSGLFYSWAEKTYYFDTMENRLSGNDISTGRFDLWEDYGEYILHSPKTLLLGDGLGAPFYHNKGPHNTYIEAIYFLGICGSTLFLITLISIFCSKCHAIRKNFLNYALVLVFFIMISTLGCLTMNDLMFYCMLLWMSLNMDTTIKEGGMILDES